MADPQVLIAVVTCARLRERADTQRAIWVPDVKGADVRFFIGGGEQPLRHDEVILDVGDKYADLPKKVRAMFRWALDRGYTHVFKIDDDIYLRPERLLASGFEKHDYAGRERGPSGGFQHPYCSGFGYWVSRKAMQVLVGAPAPRDTAEDRWVGNTLRKAGIRAHPDYRYKIVKSQKNAISGNDGPRIGNDVIAAGELDSESMRKIHDLFLTKPITTVRGPAVGAFDDIAIMIKTFLRDGFLLKTIEDVERNLPGAKMIIVDDGLESKRKISLYAELRDRGHTCAWLPFDSGFCAKANESLKYLDRDYLLIGSDDFDFSPTAAAGVAKLLTVLRNVSDLGMASGRCDGTPYEGFIEKGYDYIREHPLTMDDFETVEGIQYKRCDLTVNYGLVRKGVFDSGVRWADYKIGGDHFEWFDQVKLHGWPVAYVKGVNIRQQRPFPGAASPEYGKYRARAVDALPAFFAKYGITKYICFDGRADVLENGKIVSRQLFKDERTPEPIAASDVNVHGNVYRIPAPLYLAATGDVVGRSYKGSKRLLFRQGATISLIEAEKYGLIGE